MNLCVYKLLKIDKMQTGNKIPCVYFTNLRRKYIRFILLCKYNDIDKRTNNSVIFLFDAILYLWIHLICIMTVIGCVN